MYSNAKQVTVISRLIATTHAQLKIAANKLDLDIKGGKHELLVRLADFLLTE